MTTSRENHRIKYGPAHQALRKSWAPRVATGSVCCAHPGCGAVIEPDAKWDLGHRYDEHGNPLESLPMHRGCNRNTAHSDRERDTGRFNEGRPGNKGGPRNSRKWGSS